MKQKLKRAYLIISSLFLSLLHLPVVFAKSASGARLFIDPADSIKTASNNNLPLIPVVQSIYDSLHLHISGLSQQAFDYAKRGMEKLIRQGKVINDSIISIIDFSQPSNKKRLFVVDLKNEKVLFNTLVAHGKNSGREFANSFSNQPSSFKSSPGFYVTGTTYNGHNGYSLKLEGLERGINDNAYDRAVVMHGADYVSQSFVNARGYTGRSEGCPAVPVKDAPAIINSIKDGSCLFVYTPDPSYLSHSGLLN